MAEQPVGDLAGGLGHQRADSGEHDLRVAVWIAARIEERRHQRVRVELAAEIKRRAAFPAVPDRPDREHELAHPRRRLGPLHRIAPRDVRLDLRAEAEHEPPSRKRLQVVSRHRDGHRVARERHGDRGAELDPLGSLRRDGAGEERVDLRLRRPPAASAALAAAPAWSTDGQYPPASIFICALRSLAT